MDELTKKVRILKCKEKDLTHNVSIAHSKELEMPCTASNIFSKGRYFYMMFYETSRVYTFRFKGKWI